ncbi:MULTISPECIES: SDR family oxidoreductase [unclassified Novosphingobium]|uniref:SDR family oxidoreductase n=1 Tax=unclassified Novosphingobium TaxID=2644732 RepID=UPI00146DC7D9|nr:NAD(P)-dependent dehydrogenase (short-subunit alcohol dehydrogenase family) [Novosphingobium sp. SG919]NMN85978.1 NAD(P)-dependent dehydrogenase (short-subunit alcohol dehydrogenase family) [Novosphingobium sp. SG916]
MSVDAIRMDGKVAIVTGGAGGIGAATARLLTARGARVAIADIAFDRARELADAIDGALAIHLDLEREDSVEAMIADTVKAFGRIDVLHNNAALLGPDIAQNDGDVEHMATALWDRTFAVNVRGTMIGCRAALPHLRATRGNIVNTVSNLALQGHMIQAAYSSSKAAIIQMTRAIAASHGVHGVRCNAVAPGMTMTPALREAFPPALRKVVEDETLRDRLGAPEDIAEAVAFLASDAARNITGQVLVADGGGASHVPGLAGFRAFFSGEHA